MKKGIYLASGNALHENANLVYNDKFIKRDNQEDMLLVDISKYDYIIATPPCNYWSRANWRREQSEYSQNTKHLLPEIINKLLNQNKPFIVENVRNDKLFNKYGLLDKKCNIYKIGRHTYWTNIEIDTNNLVNQKVLTDIKNGKKRYLSSQNLPKYLRQGGKEVHEIIERFINKVNK